MWIETVWRDCTLRQGRVSSLREEGCGLKRLDPLLPKEKFKVSSLREEGCGLKQNEKGSRMENQGFIPP